jgi:hypothetical protein
MAPRWDTVGVLAGIATLAAAAAAQAERRRLPGAQPDPSIPPPSGTPQTAPRGQTLLVGPEEGGNVSDFAGGNAIYHAPAAKLAKTARARTVWGLLLHTSGRGIPTKARAQGKTPIAVALDVYTRSQDGRLHPYTWGGPSYILDLDGTIHQLAPDSIFTAHAGGPDAATYRKAGWERARGVGLQGNRMAPAFSAAWHAQWDDFAQTPIKLCPHGDPNVDYVGVEMLPVGAGFGLPLRPGLLFTQASHDAIAAFARDFGRRHAFPPGWEFTPRFLGHEDVQPLQRGDARGGFDPGYLRAAPYFDFAYVRARVRSSEGG